MNPPISVFYKLASKSNGSLYNGLFKFFNNISLSITSNNSQIYSFIPSVLDLIIPIGPQQGNPDILNIAYYTKLHVSLNNPSVKSSTI